MTKPHHIQCPISHWSPGELAQEAVKRGIALADFAPVKKAKHPLAPFCPLGVGGWRGAFFKTRPPYNRIAIVIGLTPNQLTPKRFGHRSRRFVSCMSAHRNKSAQGIQVISTDVR